MFKDMICNGCKGNLRMGRDILIRMTNGVLYLGCPLCKYESRITVEIDGTVNIVKLEGDT